MPCGSRSAAFDEDTYDSDEFPKGPIEASESDSPEHCGNCGMFLENALTSEGIAYVRESGDAELTGFYGIEFDEPEVSEPCLKLLPLCDFHLDGGLIIFGICNSTVRLAFDARVKNVAGQWSIINADTGFQITFTMASFWSAPLWTWVVKRRPIWLDSHPSIIVPPGSHHA